MLSLTFKNSNCIDALPAGCIEFLTSLMCEFTDDLDALLENRISRQIEFDNGTLPTFPKETSHIRSSDWEVAPVAIDILDRRVEITGPPDRKMVINALNSGANVYMADFEDSLSPTWENVVSGQRNLADAVRGTIRYRHPTKGVYKLNKDHATLFVRPRGLHLKESNVLMNDKSVSAALFDFGVYMYINAKYLFDHGRAPYFYIPKLEHYTEARWWNSVFTWAQEKLSIPHGTVKATVLLETLPAAFQMDEILYELRDHSAGLNCGRWDYIFSYIKTFRNDPTRVLPDRSHVTMSTPFMTAYSHRVIQVCHRRGIHAMGGMAAQIPIRNDPEANEVALNKVRDDKRREVFAGHDGTWVAHPGLVSIAKEIFDEFMPEANQINLATDYGCTEGELITACDGHVTETGLRQNISVGYQYLSQWIDGNGCVPINNLMEDAATAEISRTQIWQWRTNRIMLTNGEILTGEYLKSVMIDELGDDRSTRAGQLFERMCFQDTLQDFLTLEAYKEL